MQGYASAKSGILGLTRAQAVSLDKKVRVNTVLPGWIVTPGSQARLTQDIHDWHLTGKLPDCTPEVVQDIRHHPPHRSQVHVTLGHDKGYQRRSRVIHASS